ncbi:MAG: ThiF family adenylyltransferase [Planctomycetes bacterium]|nr:ThiF family adenylyltransferase [Planctomycetota bacterium]
MQNADAYSEWTSRNSGYLGEAAQERLRTARILIAGCGLGSVVAELLVRTGCTNFVVADGDRVEVHNLNRQMFCHADLGRNKAEALAARLGAIHPHIRVKALPQMLDESNLVEALHGVDYVVDSIDFLDAHAILALHRHARQLGLPVFSPVAAGWGAAAFVFDPAGMSLQDLVGGVAPHENGVSYASLFMEVLERYAEVLPPYVSKVVQSQFHRIRDRHPCPISQLGSGTFTAAALTVALITQHLSGSPVPCAPFMIQLDPVVGSRTFAPETTTLKQPA